MGKNINVQPAYIFNFQAAIVLSAVITGVKSHAILGGRSFYLLTKGGFRVRLTEKLADFNFSNLVAAGFT
jgi:hypothetical protein